MYDAYNRDCNECLFDLHVCDRCNDVVGHIHDCPNDDDEDILDGEGLLF